MRRLPQSDGVGPTTVDRLTGPQRCAVLLQGLPPAASLRLMSGMRPNESQLISSELNRMPKPSIALEEEVNLALWTCTREISGMIDLPKGNLRSSKTLVADLCKSCPDVLVGVMRSAWLAAAAN